MTKLEERIGETSPAQSQSDTIGTPVSTFTLGSSEYSKRVSAGIERSGGEGGINIHRLNFAINTGKFLPLLPTLPVTLRPSRTCILPVFLENQIAHILVAVVVSPEFTTVLNTRRLPNARLRLFRGKDRSAHRNRQILAEDLSGKCRKFRFENAPRRLA